jgi:hypothetical protein
MHPLNHLNLSSVNTDGCQRCRSSYCGVKGRRPRQGIHLNRMQGSAALNGEPCWVCVYKISFAEKGWSTQIEFGDLGPTPGPCPGRVFHHQQLLMAVKFRVSELLDRYHIINIWYNTYYYG